jgi:hypothetical protein
LGQTPRNAVHFYTLQKLFLTALYRWSADDRVFPQKVSTQPITWSNLINILKRAQILSCSLNDES